MIAFSRATPRMSRLTAFGASMTRARSNALYPGDPRMPNWLNPQYRLVVPNSGPYRPDPSGYKLFYGNGHLATEGWKFHVSAHPHTAERLAGILLPLLTALDVWHKYLELHTLRTRTGEDIGKFMAYYPRSPAHAHLVAMRIAQALATQGSNRLDVPAIAGERRFGATGILYTRYGSYQYDSVKGPPGSNTRSGDPARGIKPYHATGRLRPSWIPDLWQDTSTAVFPQYDARRTLHGLPESTQPWVN